MGNTKKTIGDIAKVAIELGAKQIIPGGGHAVTVAEFQILVDNMGIKDVVPASGAQFTLVF